MAKAKAQQQDQNQNQNQSQPPSDQGMSAMKLEKNPDSGAGSSIQASDEELDELEAELEQFNGEESGDVPYEVIAQQMANADAHEIAIMGVMAKSKKLSARGGLWTVCELDEEEADSFISIFGCVSDIVSNRIKKLFKALMMRWIA